MAKRILELFAGTRSISRIFDMGGWESLTLDLNHDFNVDIKGSVLDVDPKVLMDFRPDVVWASPPCTSFSIASVSHHWKDGHPDSEGSLLGIKLLCRTLELIMLCRPKYWFIENPRGMMRKLDFMSLLPKNTITYCQYGDERMKPTDVWTNCDIWVPKTMCKNGDPCHESVPRGSKTGTQGRGDAIERSRIPYNLGIELFEAIDPEGFKNLDI